ncbi:MAG TPA: 2-amino-4-hydroxy-6-hydroxymethyldihydropteridine diphosphokinase [Thermoanaerobaculia bacterium]|nr:2-amino-4-hydroxy-6-hydroxymethyldihydropteridine diphosphokinase [Thermoanaerobaculia bacterium]
MIALGSNLGDREWHLRRALHQLRRAVRLVRISGIYETAPVDAPPGSPDFLNMAAAGLTSLTPVALLDELLRIETELGRVRTTRNAPRVIDLDLIFYGALRMRSARLTIPHPRYHEREFVLQPLSDLGLGWQMEGLR